MLNSVNPYDYVNVKNRNLWDLDVLDGISFLNCNRVHPLKQRDMQYIVEAAKQDSEINGLIVFGSSVQFRCNSKSDIDLFVVRSDNKKMIDERIFSVQSELDILFSSSAGVRLKKILMDTGVLVYVKEGFSIV